MKQKKRWKKIGKEFGIQGSILDPYVAMETLNEQSNNNNNNTTEEKESLENNKKENKKSIHLCYRINNPESEIEQMEDVGHGLGIALTKIKNVVSSQTQVCRISVFFFATHCIFFKVFVFSKNTQSVFCEKKQFKFFKMCLRFINIW